ncbi:MAG: MFS transporter [Chloroflexota bacterium]|jgi:MFS family permease|tara:strand:+ start:5930 stop:7168 length:1239 start_codon:yes stop_codon:yes gene_type:complete
MTVFKGFMSSNFNTPGRVWLIMLAPFLVATVSMGSYQYTHGLFVDPLGQAFGWSRTEVSASLSFAAVGIITAPFLGRLLDKYGAKPVMLCSVALMGSSFVLRPFMTELWHLYAISFLQFMAINGTVMLPAGRLVGIWFKKNRGQVLGITMMGNNFGGLVLPPVIGAILVSFSWQIAYYAIAIMFALVWLYTLKFVSENKVSDSKSNINTRISTDPAQILPGMTLQEAIKTKSFYLIAIITPIGSLAFSMVLPHVIDNYTNAGVSLLTAASGLVVLSTFGMIGKIFWGAVGEKITGRKALMCSFSVTIVGIVLMYNPVAGPLLWIAAAVFGLGMGAFGPLYTMIIQDLFGLRNYGAISGLLGLTGVISFGAGPIMGGLSYDMAGTYKPIILAASIGIAIGVLLLTQVPGGRKY